jgi:hypothetical protein
MVHSNKEKKKKMNTTSLNEHARPSHGKNEIRNQSGELEIFNFL